MTERLYYTDSFLQIFKRAWLTCATGRTARQWYSTVLRFIPPAEGRYSIRDGFARAGMPESKIRVVSVEEDETTGEVLHFVADANGLTSGTVIEGAIDTERRRDHMQQHTGQHVLSAAFEQMYNFPTVSFHMGDESCTIDLATDAVTARTDQRTWRSWRTRSSSKIGRLRFALPRLRKRAQWECARSRRLNARSCASSTSRTST